MKKGQSFEISGIGKVKIVEIIEQTDKYTKVSVTAGKGKTFNYTIYQPVVDGTIADDGLDDKIARQEKAAAKRKAKKKKTSEEESE